MVVMNRNHFICRSRNSHQMQIKAKLITWCLNSKTGTFLLGWHLYLFLGCWFYRWGGALESNSGVRRSQWGHTRLLGGGGPGEVKVVHQQRQDLPAGLGSGWRHIMWPLRVYRHRGHFCSQRLWLCRHVIEGACVQGRPNFEGAVLDLCCSKNWNYELKEIMLWFFPGLGRAWWGWGQPWMGHQLNTEQHRQTW